LPQYEFNRKYNNDVYYFLRERVRNKSIIKNPGSSWDYTVLSFIVMNLISGCATTKGFWGRCVYLDVKVCATV